MVVVAGCSALGTSSTASVGPSAALGAAATTGAGAGGGGNIAPGQKKGNYSQAGRHTLDRQRQGAPAGSARRSNGGCCAGTDGQCGLRLTPAGEGVPPGRSEGVLERA